MMLTVFRQLQFEITIVRDIIKDAEHKVLVDETLTFKGQAADAYIVGREVDTLTQEITNVKVEVGNVEVLLKMI